MKIIRQLGLWMVLSMAANFAHAQTLDVRIEPMEDLIKFRYQPIGDEAIVMTSDSFPVEITRLNTLEQLEISNVAGSLKLSKDGKLLGTYGPIVIWNQDTEPRFNILLDRQKNPSIMYSDHLKVLPSGRFLTLVNKVHLENYIFGVIHAEAGHHKSMEFFKVQAASARTYALRHLGKHSKEGFDVCDKTHCQAYHGYPPKASMIRTAVDETRHEVIVHDGNKLVEAVFSANCGGFTANSEDVWIASVDYLRAIPDYNFCEGFNNHAWHVTIPKLDFLAKLGRYHDVNARSFTIIPDISGRVKRAVVNEDEKLAISGEELRRLFKLKSAKFHVYDSNDLLFIEGAGFGHGVGMCQDGAYFLSSLGYDYEKIIKHYYQGVELIPLSQVDGLWSAGAEAAGR